MRVASVASRPSDSHMPRDTGASAPWVGLARAARLMLLRTEKGRMAPWRCLSSGT